MSDIDDIIREVREQAQLEQDRFRAVATFEPLSDHQGERRDNNGFDSHNAQRPTRAQRPVEKVDDLLCIADSNEFLRAAYERILGRDADLAGFTHYRDMLDKGCGQIFVIAALSASSEARRKGSRLPGLGISVVVYGAWQIMRRLGLGVVGLQINRAYNGWRHLRLVLNGRYLTEFNYVNMGADALDRRIDEHADSLLSLREDLFSVQTNCLSWIARVDPAAAAATGGDFSALPTLEATTQSKLAGYYLAFEAQYRGDEEKIKDQQRSYLRRVNGLAPELCEKAMLDVGCGRGEWLSLLSEAGFAGLGVDTNPLIVQQCLNRGLNVELRDALDTLTERADASLAVVSAFHIVEHLPFHTLFRLMEEARRVIAPGGLLLLETPNPENVLVGSHTFYHDFSHRNPVTPESLCFLVRYMGFDILEVERLNPYGTDAYIREETLAAERLNGHLYGPQDFAIIATVTGPGT